MGLEWKPSQRHLADCWGLGSMLRKLLAFICGGAHCYISTPHPATCNPSTWSSWGPCSLSCGSGVKTRSRTTEGCIAMADRQMYDCKAAECDIDCVVSSWGPWTPCSAEFAGGFKTRTRVIITFRRARAARVRRTRTAWCATRRLAPRRRRRRRRLHPRMVLYRASFTPVVVFSRPKVSRQPACWTRHRLSLTWS